MKDKIKQLLLGTGREGMPKLIEALEQWGYFESPASTRFHGSHEGGLMDHSYKVFKAFHVKIAEMDLSQEKMPRESIIICSLLHDVCKAGLYISGIGCYTFNSELGMKGHAKLSLDRIQTFIKLTDQEKNIIKYHMGYYATRELAKTSTFQTGEYSLAELNQANNQERLTKLFHWCDDEDSAFWKEKRT